MIGKLLGVILTLLAIWKVQGQNISPPEVKGSYIAWGEIAQPLEPITAENGSLVLQMSFEESFDANSKNSAFILYLSGKNMTFSKNYALNQTFLYIETKDSKTIQCSETSENEFTTSNVPPGLLSYEDDDGTVKFSITQLINIPQKFLTKDMRGVATKYRNIPAKYWVYEITGKHPDDDHVKTITVTSYWSDGSWNTSGGQREIPLGFKVSKRIESKPEIVEDYYVNVFGFLPNAYDHKFFEPVQGVICATRKQSFKFPRIKNTKAISFSFETTLPDYQEIRHTDTWFDPLNQLVRLDIQKQSTRNSESNIAIGEMGVVYRFWYTKSASKYEIIPFDKYSNDMQALVDIKQDFSKWQMDKLFGLNDTSYTYIGKTRKHDIPCHIFQGIRTDWPSKNAKVTSLWEWCFNYNMTNENDRVLLQDDDIGLIHANVIILSHPNEAYKGYRMNHHFYKMKTEDPAMLDATYFDINRGYEEDKLVLQFSVNVDVTQDNRHIAENATSDLNFLQQWKAAIYRNSGLPDYSLRVTGVRATIDDNKLIIKFILLPIHKDLPKKIKDSQISATDAEKKLRDNVNAEKVFIMYKWPKDAFKLSAQKESLSFQIDPDFEPQTLAPLPPTTPELTTPVIFSLRTDPGETTTPNGDGTTTPRGDKDKDKKDPGNTTRHKPGSVAGVSIALLLIGISIGSAGTFYKFNGLPECLKRRQ